MGAQQGHEPRNERRQHGQPLHAELVDENGVDDSCAEERSEQRCKHTDHHGERKALDFSRRSLVEHDANDQVRDIAVDDRVKRTREAQSHRVPKRFVVVYEFLADTLIDEHVGIDRHAHDKRDACQSRQSERTVDPGHDAENHGDVQGNGYDRDKSGAQVVADDQDARGNRSQNNSPQTTV